jgi:hypothetical protein
MAKRTEINYAKALETDIKTRRWIQIRLINILICFGFKCSLRLSSSHPPPPALLTNHKKNLNWDIEWKCREKTIELHLTICRFSSHRLQWSSSFPVQPIFSLCHIQNRSFADEKYKFKIFPYCMQIISSIRFNLIDITSHFIREVIKSNRDAVEGVL